VQLTTLAGLLAVGIVAYLLVFYILNICKALLAGLTHFAERRPLWLRMILWPFTAVSVENPDKVASGLFASLALVLSAYVFYVQEIGRPAVFDVECRSTAGVQEIRIANRTDVDPRECTIQFWPTLRDSQKKELDPGRRDPRPVPFECGVSPVEYSEPLWDLAFRASEQTLPNYLHQRNNAGQATHVDLIDVEIRYESWLGAQRQYKPWRRVQCTGNGQLR
jgi:hypothetical protein